MSEHNQKNRQVNQNRSVQTQRNGQSRNNKNSKQRRRSEQYRIQNNRQLRRKPNDKAPKKSTNRIAQINKTQEPLITPQSIEQEIIKQNDIVPEIEQQETAQTIGIEVYHKKEPISRNNINLSGISKVAKQSSTYGSSINLSNGKVTKRAEKKEKNKGSKLLLLLLFIFTFSFVYSATNIVEWQKDNESTKEMTEIIEEVAEVVEVEDNENVDVIEQEKVIPKNNPYWSYIRIPLIDVDFNELKKTNNETAGWIQVKGTNINYPFVQTNNNSFYLKHTFNKSYNNAGWVFLDYRNRLSTHEDRNTIIYAHGRVDTTMFGSLKNILSSGWLKNTDNYIVRLSTEHENTLWQVFSVYHIPTTNDYIKINFKNDEEFLAFADILLKRSAHNFNTDVQASDKILTLSTCYNNKEKVVLHAKLIKREIKE